MARLALVSLLLVTGCADQMLSTDRIRDSTSATLGQPVTIANRHSDGPTNTSYTAITRRGSYACTINGGGVLAMGMTNPPQCQRVGMRAAR